MPIKDASGEVVGVAQVINKLGGGECFTANDEKVGGLSLLLSSFERIFQKFEWLRDIIKLDELLSVVSFISIGYLIAFSIDSIALKILLLFGRKRKIFFCYSYLCIFLSFFFGLKTAKVG